MGNWDHLTRERLESLLDHNSAELNRLYGEFANLLHAVELLVECDYCGAPVEYRCVTKSGAVAQPFQHAARNRWARAVAEGRQQPYLSDD